MSDLEVKLVGGADLGKITDYSAFAVLRGTRLAPPKGGVRIVQDPAMGKQTITDPFADDRRKPQDKLWKYELVRLDRWEPNPGSMLYTGISERLAKYYSRSVEQQGLGGTVLAFDRTGVGVAVEEMIIKAMQHAGARAQVRPINITGGTKVTAMEGGAGFNVPKRELVSVLQALMGTKRLKISEELPNCRALVRELDHFRVKQDATTGHESYESWRERDHDDLVLALAIAAWVAERASRQFWIA